MVGLKAEIRRVEGTEGERRSVVGSEKDSVDLPLSDFIFEHQIDKGSLV